MTLFFGKSVPETFYIYTSIELGDSNAYVMMSHNKFY